MATFVTPPTTFHITTPAAPAGDLAQTTSQNQNTMAIAMQRLVDQTLAAASADPLDIWLQPLVTTAPPAELIVERLTPPPRPHARDRRPDAGGEAAIAFELLIDEHTHQGLAQHRAELEAEVHAARRLRAHSRKTRGTRETKRETATSKEILRAKQAARLRKIQERARRRHGAREPQPEASGAGEDRA